MTREYNKPGRNDSRPPFRQNSSSRYGEEQSSRPGRPRLNREIVDRAWEQGAQTQHADYRARTNNGQGRQNNRRSSQPEYSPYQNSTGGSRPYGNRRQANNTGDYRSYGNRQQTNNGNGYQSYDNRQDNYRRSGPTPQGYRGTQQPPYNRDRYQERGNRINGDRPFQQRHYDQQGTPGNRRGGYRSGPPYSYEDQAPGRYGRNGHRPPYEEHFEGDYEHFGYDHTRNRTGEKPQRHQHYRREESAPPTRERHVTRLPDGRVIKGSRPAQRKQAQFWTEVTDETEGLLHQIPEPPAQETTRTDGVKEKKARSPRTKKPDTAPSKGTARGKKSASKEQQSTGLKPSQRGFKWPTQ